MEPSAALGLLEGDPTTGLSHKASYTSASLLGHQGDSLVTSPIRQVRLKEPAVCYDYVYAIKQGVDSMNRVVEPVELELLHVY